MSVENKLFEICKNHVKYSLNSCSEFCRYNHGSYWCELFNGDIPHPHGRQFHPQRREICKKIFGKSKGI